MAVYFGIHLGSLFKCIQREENRQSHSWYDWIYLKLNTGIHDKICLHVHICTQWIRHESVLHIFSVVCYGNMHDNVALWEDARQTQYWGVSAGKGNCSGNQKQQSLACFYSSLISAENGSCTKIMYNFHCWCLRHSAACRHTYSHNPIICDTKHAKCI